MAHAVMSVRIVQRNYRGEATLTLLTLLHWHNWPREPQLKCAPVRPVRLILCIASTASDKLGNKSYKVSDQRTNQKLSQERAKNVSTHLASLGVTNTRITMIGYGEGQPVAENETAEGKAKNSRVELAIFVNDKMKKAAKNGTLD